MLRGTGVFPSCDSARSRYACLPNHSIIVSNIWEHKSVQGALLLVNYPQKLQQRDEMEKCSIELKQTV